MEDLHSKCVVYNNLKPSKILTSLDFETNNLYLTDYKFSKLIKEQTKIEADNKSKRVFLNKFSSLNAHLGISSINLNIFLISFFLKDPTNKDDLESLGYILIYFYKRGTITNSF